jgi:hypothetical protein
MIINASVTAKASVEKAKAFLIGNGFANGLNDVVVYEDVNGKVTLYNILTRIAHTISRHNAASLNVQYDGNFEVSGLKSIPYRDCRYGKADSNDYSGFIHVYDNWDKKRGVKFDPKEAQKINVFNPSKKVIEQQFKNGYLGQCSILRLDDEYVYPLAPIDPSLEDADTEAQIKGFKNGELRKGFFAKYILYHTEFATVEEQMDFKNVLKKFEGGDHTSSILMAEAEFDQETGEFIKSANFQLQKLDQNINDKIFESYEKSVANNIRKTIWNIPSILIEQQEASMFGQSGEGMKVAFDIFNAETKNARAQISQWLKTILANSKNRDLRTADYTITPLTF